MLRIAIILGSTRPGRVGEAVSKWVYGIARAIEHLRLVMASLHVATVTPQVGLSMFTDFESFSVFKPAPAQEQYVHRMLDQVIAWSGALGAAEPARVAARLAHNDRRQARSRIVNNPLGVWTNEDCALVLIDYQKRAPEALGATEPPMLGHRHPAENPAGPRH